MLNPVRFGVANPRASKARYDTAPTAGERDAGVSDQDGEGQGVICRLIKA